MSFDSCCIQTLSLYSIVELYINNNIYRISLYKRLSQINAGPVYTPGVQGAV